MKKIAVLTLIMVAAIFLATIPEAVSAQEIETTEVPTATDTEIPTETAIPSPTSTPEATATATPKPDFSNWRVEFDLEDFLFCQAEAGWISASGQVFLPEGVSAKLQLAWHVVAPEDQKTDIDYYDAGAVSNGDRFSFLAWWPGIRPGDSLVEIHWGAALLDVNTSNPVGKNDGLDAYWRLGHCSVTPTANPTSTEETETPVPTETATPTKTAIPTGPTTTPTNNPTESATPDNPSGPTATTTSTPLPSTGLAKRQVNPTVKKVGLLSYAGQTLKVLRTTENLSISFNADEALLMDKFVAIHLSNEFGIPEAGAILAKLAEGRRLWLIENNRTSVFEVINTFVIERNDFELIFDSNANLVAFTCWGEFDPVSRTFSHYKVVEFKEVDPIK
jgi:hypothetical protein